MTVFNIFGVILSKAARCGKPFSSVIHLMEPRGLWCRQRRGRASDDEEQAVVYLPAKRCAMQARNADALRVLTRRAAIVLFSSVQATTDHGKCTGYTRRCRSVRA